MAEGNFLQLIGVVKTFDGRRVIDKVTLHVDAGEIVLLLGRPKAGKSTLLQIALGRVRTDEGTIIIGGRDATGLPEKKIRSLGIVGIITRKDGIPWRYRLFKSIWRPTVECVLAAHIKAASGVGDPHRSSDRATTKDFLTEFDLSHVAKASVMKLSSGERTRFQIACCLTGNPRLLLLDNVFAGIEGKTQHWILSKMLELRNRGISIVYSDNTIESVGNCDRACLLFKGRVVVQGIPDAVRKNPDFERLYLKSTQIGPSVVSPRENEMSPRIFVSYRRDGG